MKIKNEYPKARAYLKKRFPEVTDGEITRAFCSIPPNTPEWVVIQLFKLIEKTKLKEMGFKSLEEFKSNDNPAQEG